MKFKEIETKYNANDIALEDFKRFCDSLVATTETIASSYDHYYEKQQNQFIRYRAGSKPELTIKKKTKAKNNFVRTEINLPLDKKLSEKNRLKIVDAFCGNLGFLHNFTIFKVCHIYFYHKFNLVYYAVFDENLEEQSRFIEIEMDEEFNWPSEAAAWRELMKIEKKLNVLGINRKDRINDSLYEMFRKA